MPGAVPPGSGARGGLPPAGRPATSARAGKPLNFNVLARVPAAAHRPAADDRRGAAEMRHAFNK